MPGSVKVAFAALLVDLASRHDGWLQQPVEEMLAAIQTDWSAWKKAQPGP